jgi:hypothetical protein
MVHVVGGGPSCDVDGGRFALELPTNHECVVANSGVDLDVYDGSIHRGILGAEKG